MIRQQFIDTLCTGDSKNTPALKCVREQDLERIASFLSRYADIRSPADLGERQYLRSLKAESDADDLYGHADDAMFCLLIASGQYVPSFKRESMGWYKEFSVNYLEGIKDDLVGVGEELSKKERTLSEMERGLYEDTFSAVVHRDASMHLLAENRDWMFANWNDSSSVLSHGEPRHGDSRRPYGGNHRDMRKGATGRYFHMLRTALRDQQERKGKIALSNLFDVLKQQRIIDGKLIEQVSFRDPLVYQDILDALRKGIERDQKRSSQESFALAGKVADTSLKLQLFERWYRDLRNNPGEGEEYLQLFRASS